MPINQSQCGDLVKAFKENKFDAIVHGSNCWCNHGKGIAKTISSNFPSALKADQQTIPGDKTKLGSYTFTETKHGHIINAYTQYNYGYGKRNADYDAIKLVFEKLNQDYSGKNHQLFFETSEQSWQEVLEDMLRGWLND